MDFVACQLLEKSREHRVPLHLIFYNLQRAFNSICRPTLWKILTKFGLLPQFIPVLQKLQDNMTGQVLHRGTTSQSFPIQTGAKQGCVLAPTLFSLYLTALHCSLPYANTDVVTSSKLKGNVFNTSLLRTKSLCQNISVNDLQYADNNKVPCH